eukprot:1082522-Pyramimonas_sp.AAC.1
MSGLGGCIEHLNTPLLILVGSVSGAGDRGAQRREGYNPWWCPVALVCAVHRPAAKVAEGRRKGLQF